MNGDEKRPGESAPQLGEEGFLERWSRRKALARQGEELEPDPLAEREDAPSPGGADEYEAASAGESVGDANAGEKAASEAEMSDAELAERYGVPDPAALGEGADYSVYMKGGVPDRLRNAALRKLWRSSPDLACLDELLEYGDDFTGTGVVGALKTAYEVGSGFKKRIEAWEKEQAEKQEAEKEEAARAAALKEAEASEAVASSETDGASDGASDDADSAEPGSEAADRGESEPPNGLETEKAGSQKNYSRGAEATPALVSGGGGSAPAQESAMLRRRMRFRF